MRETPEKSDKQKVEEEKHWGKKQFHCRQLFCVFLGFLSANALSRAEWRRCDGYGEVYACVLDKPATAAGYICA